MDVIKRISLSIISLVLTLHSYAAETLQKGKTKFRSLLNVYHQNSEDGKQVYDGSGREEVNVIEPMLFIEHQITEDTNIDAHFVLDFWTAASDTKLDANTGASGGGIKEQTRGSGNINIRSEFDKWALVSGVGFSTEYDYRSLNGKIGIEKSMAEDNFVLGVGLQYYADKLKYFKDLTPANNASISEFESRNILALGVSGTQILTKKDLLQVSFNYVAASDHLESTASSVLVNNIRESEVLPDDRKRYALSSKWVHGVTDTSAINVFYRYYTDSWELDAHTIRFAYLKEINDDEDFIELAVRLHDQKDVEYYSDSFDSAKEYMTSDSDMDKFSSCELSGFLSTNLSDQKFLGLSLEDVSMNNGLTVYKRSNGLKFGYLQSSIGFKF